MKTEFAADDLAASVIAVPPLCRDARETVNAAENARLIRWIESGGVRTLLYGGNANVYNLAPGEFEPMLDALESAAGSDTAVIPSIGPYFGVAMEQAAILSRRKFPTAMLLPAASASTPEGVRLAVHRLVAVLGRPLVLYVKEEKYVTPAIAGALVDSGALAWIKYAVVRPDPSNDPWLKALCDAVDPRLVVSGIGEQPAPVHLRAFNLGGFTTGCGCLAPRLSMELLGALRRAEWDRAEKIRRVFLDLENLRNAHGPIQVLHHAVTAAGIAEGGPLLPLLAAPEDAVSAEVAAAAAALRAADTGQSPP